MIKRSDILSIPFLKKSRYTGSYQGMRYRLEKYETEEAVTLKTTIWAGPYSYETTREEKESREFPFSEDGILQTVDWLNEKWKEQKDRWLRAQNNW